MTSTVKKVFILIGVLVLIFLIWQVVFNNGGIVRTAYDAVADVVNTQWHKVAGDGADDLLPTWGETGADTNGTGVDIDTGTGVD